jgi:hypothetical protein
LYLNENSSTINAAKPPVLLPIFNLWILATQLQSINTIHHIHNDAHMVNSSLACGKNNQSNWDGPDVELDNVAHCLLLIKTKVPVSF